MDENKFQLITSAKNGDVSSLDKIIKLEQNNIFAMLLYLNKNENDVYDMMQEVLIKISNKISQLNNPEFFKTWLNKIIVNTYNDYIRKSKKLQVLSFANEISENVPDNKSNPIDKIIYSELDLTIKKTIQNLPCRYKIPIALREIQGMSYENISKVTNTNIGTIKSRIARARCIIKDEIRKYEK